MRIARELATHCATSCLPCSERGERCSARKLLQQIGLNKYEAEAYYALLTRGPLTGYEVGKYSQVPGSRSYEILERLREKGLVLVQPGDPPRYRAQEPRAIFDRFRATMETTLTTLTMSLASLAHGDRMGEFWVVRGQQNILAQVRSMIANAQVMEADATHLPFEDRTFDLIISHLGLNNFADPQAALAECFRVARSRARIVLTTNPTGNMSEFYEVFRATLRDLQKPAYLERLQVNETHRGTKESISGMLQKAGFRVVKSREDRFQLRYVDGSALFHHLLTQVGFLDGWRQVVEAEDEEQVFALLETRLNQVARAQGELGLTVPMLYLEGEKPA